MSKKVKSWKELGVVEGYFVTDASSVIKSSVHPVLRQNRNIFPEHAQAEACIALAQLCQLIKHYNGDWKPNYLDGTFKYSIVLDRGNLTISSYTEMQRLLTFPTLKRAENFLKCFRDLIETAKPLL